MGYYMTDSLYWDYTGTWDGSDHDDILLIVVTAEMILVVDVDFQCKLGTFENILFVLVYPGTAE